MSTQKGAMGGQTLVNFMFRFFFYCGFKPFWRISGP